MWYQNPRSAHTIALDARAYPRYQPPIVLCTCYAMSGTDIGDVRYWHTSLSLLPPDALATALPGTDA
eukprot:1430361-Rhodomonas_salina.7